MAASSMYFRAAVILLVAGPAVSGQNEQVPDEGTTLDTCWYECVEYGELDCNSAPVASNPYQGRRLAQFGFSREFSNPVPDDSPEQRASLNARSGASSSFAPKPIDDYTFAEKCDMVSQCKHIEGSGVPCGWCQTGTGFGLGFPATCRKDGVGNCYPRQQCSGIWTWQYFRCPADNAYGCVQPCKYHIKKCVDSNFDNRPVDPLEIVDEDFQYFPSWVNGR
mmetsp:Transcript_20246/g.52905  ORF Transcript_20246/g.52905 Transcript_20246/m.52905 type:complete len:221 (-) Transcript_20246:186-848(-)